MEFFNSAIDVLQTLVIALGGGLCVWGGINLLEGYGQDNPAAKSQGVKQLVAGGGVSKNIWNCFRTAPAWTGQPLTCSTSGMGLRLK